MYTPPFLGLVLYMYPQSRHSHKEFTYTSLPPLRPKNQRSIVVRRSLKVITLDVYLFLTQMQMFIECWGLCYTCILNQDIVTKSLLILLFESDNPGCIFIFNSDADVHRVLGLVLYMYPQSRHVSSIKT